MGNGIYAFSLTGGDRMIGLQAELTQLITENIKMG
jgi:hypothetical protein